MTGTNRSAARLLRDLVRDLVIGGRRRMHLGELVGCIAMVSMTVGQLFVNVHYTRSEEVLNAHLIER